MSDKLELKEVLALVDLRSVDVWKELTDEQQKFLKRDFYTLNRYISSVVSSDENVLARSILAVNSNYNKHWNDLQKHPELLWKLLCFSASPAKSIETHEWIGYKKSTKSNNKIGNFLNSIYPLTKQDDIDTMVNILSKDDIKTLAKDHGLDNKQIAALFK